MDCYMADWHRLDGKRMKIVLMVIMRSQRPAQVEVPFFIVSLAAFNRVESASDSVLCIRDSCLDAYDYN